MRDEALDKFEISRRAFLGTLAVAPLPAVNAGTGWVELFDGRTLSGWTASEHKDSWKVVDGMLTANGARSHLFYSGPVRGGDFRNFELQVELITQPDCNSGVYFHTKYQESGFPEKGFEIQVNNTAHGDGGYLERKKTGSLYGLRNMYMQLVPDLKPFQYDISVRGKNVQIRLNGQLLVDYVEPTPAVVPAGGEKGRFLDHGTFALQCHNNGSRVAFRKVRVRPLPDDLPAYSAEAPAPVADDVFRRIIDVGRHNVPLVDYHAFLQEDLSLDRLLAKSRRDGLQYGITALSSRLGDDTAVETWIGAYAGKPVFRGLQAEDPNWMKTISRKSAQRFDYVMADSRTWLNEAGRPVRLWVPQEAASIEDRQAFMDSLLAQTVRRIETEPVDLYTHATYLPASMQAEAAQLWTEERVARLIEALVRNKVAVEINTVDQLPARSFVDRAKAADCKFGFGSANRSAAELKRCEYGLQLVEQCNLDWKNFYAPGGWYPKAVERRDVGDWGAAG